MKDLHTSELSPRYAPPPPPPIAAVTLYNIFLYIFFWRARVCRHPLSS
jgi:hypothetical protein